MKRKGLHGETSGKKRRSRCRQRCPHCQQLLGKSQYHEHRKRYFNPVLKEWKTVADLAKVKASIPIPDVPGSSSSDSEGKLCVYVTSCIRISCKARVCFERPLRFHMLMQVRPLSFTCVNNSAFFEKFVMKTGKIFERLANGLKIYQPKLSPWTSVFFLNLNFYCLYSILSRPNKN